MTDLSGKTAIITGSSSGVGAASALRFAARGAKVVINYSKSRQEAEATAAACRDAGGEAMLCAADVADDAACRAMVDKTVAAWGRVDFLVNSAGTTRRCAHDDLDGLSGEDFHHIYGVNVIGVFQMVRAAAPHLRAAGDGVVVNISACGGFDGKGSSIAYAASKGALNTMTLSLARALAPDIRVNAVAPNLIDGRWVRAMMGEDAARAHVAATAGKHPLSRVNSPDDVAAAVLWLATVATTVTGEIIRLDAGHHLS